MSIYKRNEIIARKPESRRGSTVQLQFYLNSSTSDSEVQSAFSLSWH